MINWYVRVQKLKKPYRLESVDYGYWNAVKPSKRLLKRCDCKLVNIPRKVRVNRAVVEKLKHIEL
jgi:hypothetical protein